MKFPSLLLLLFSVDLVMCETTTTTRTESPPDKTPVESQLALVSKMETTTSSSTVSIESSTLTKSKTRKPSCRIVYKTVKVPSKDKLTLACTVCNFKGYKESCVYTDKKPGKTADSTTPTAQESRKSVTVKSSTEPLIEKGTEHYVPVFQTSSSTGGTVYIPRNAESSSKEEDGGSETRQDDDESEDSGDSADSGEEESKDDEKQEKSEFYFGNPSNFIPKEYMNIDYDPKFYEGHDAAANVYHKIPASFAHNDDDDSSEEESARKESRRHSYRHTAPSGFEELTKVLPDVEPINVDKVKPRKRQKTIEYNEETVFSSDDDDDNSKKSSKVTPTWKEADFEDDGDSYKKSATRNKGDHGDDRKHQNHGGYGREAYKPPFDMPAFDTKNCKVTYKNSPSGGPKMKCMNCKDKNNAYSEECGVEYEEPTKHREVYYNNGKNTPMQDHSYRSGYGSHQTPVHSYHNPYYGYTGGKRRAESKKTFVFKPFDGFYF